MNSELVNLYLFFAAIAKTALMTGIGPAIVIAVLFDKFGIGVPRPEQSESGQISGVKLELVSDSLSADPEVFHGRCA